MRDTYKMVKKTELSSFVLTEKNRPNALLGKEKKKTNQITGQHVLTNHLFFLSLYLLAVSV